jgi:DNA (cytosine-5)-methyltransferase 1
MIYYNEWDAKKAAWLEQLQKDGLLASGTTDTTDINDVLPANLSDFDRVHLFAGIGGWEYACELAGWAGPIWTASCPCQPFSAAGRRGGTADERHLFPAVHWLVQQCRPPIIVGEQVASKDGLAWLDTVFARLEATGYTCAAYDLSAASVGAPHIRQRLYWVAYTHEASQRAGSRSVRHERDDASGGGSIERLANSQEERHEQPWNARERGAGLADNGMGAWASTEWVRCINPVKGTETWRPVEPYIAKIPDGLPGGVVPVSDQGNGINAKEGGKVDGPTSETGTCEALQGLRGATEPQDVQRAAGGFGSVQETGVLQSGLHGEGLLRDHQGAERREQPEAVSQNGQARLRVLREERQPSLCPSHGLQPTQQCARELEDIVRNLPSSIALAQLRGDTATQEGLRSLLEASSAAGLLRNPSLSGETLWRSLTQEDKDRIAVDLDEGGYVILGESPLAPRVSARMVRISGYGDAIVPQLAAIFLRAVKEELNEK